MVRRLAPLTYLLVAACSGATVDDPPRDGGPVEVDAEVPTDAGRERDGGTTDGGHLDAGTPDAGNRDGGTSDAGTLPCGPNVLRCVELPSDDAVHDETGEWWYWTGHLSDTEGRWYGFQVTFFLFGSGASRATLANVALTDIEAGTHHVDVQFAFAPPQRPVDGFEFRMPPHAAVGGDGIDTLTAELDGIAMALSLTSTRTPVLHHGNGFIAYPFGGYTYYYSRPRMAASGTITIDGESRAVAGTAWFDHQWGDLSAVTAVGWDWFALQLDDGRDVMLYVIHGPDGDLVEGTVATATTSRALDVSALAVTPMSTWTSSASGCTYPMGWTIRGDGLDVEVEPAVLDQEIYNARDNSTTYWEGAAVVRGAQTGRAYVEMTGYCAAN